MSNLLSKVREAFQFVLTGRRNQAVELLMKERQAAGTHTPEEYLLFAEIGRQVRKPDQLERASKDIVSVLEYFTVERFPLERAYALATQALIFSRQGIHSQAIETIAAACGLLSWITNPPESDFLGRPFHQIRAQLSLDEAAIWVASKGEGVMPDLFDVTPITDVIQGRTTA